MSAFLERGADFARRLARYRDPARDWAALLVVAALLLAGIFGWHVYLFETVVGGGTLGSVPRVHAPAPASPLDTLPSALDARGAEDAKYVGGAYRFADPSQ